MNKPVAICADNSKIIEGGPNRSGSAGEWGAMVNFKQLVTVWHGVPLNLVLATDFTVKLAVSGAECIQLVGAKTCGSLTHIVRS